MNDISRPLCVDLDGTLTGTDTLHESLIGLVRAAPMKLAAVPFWLLRGKAGFKQALGEHVAIDATSLPYHADFLAWLREQHAAGRQLVLATAADRKIADAVAAHLGIFSDVICSEDGVNRAGNGKRDALVARYGEKGFDYAGNSRTDLPVWSAAHSAIVIGGAGLQTAAQAVAPVAAGFAAPEGGIRAWVAAMRLHQWVKNALVFLPALLAHRILQTDVLVASVLAFLAFGFCASSVYIVNDILDLESDRRHPRKCRRPFAAGKLLPLHGLAAALLMLLVSGALAWSVGWKYSAVLAGYYLLTWAYSIRLKRAALVDVMVLAALYTIRIIAGAAATGIPLSFWLLAFSVFVFISLGFVKRYTELYDSTNAGKSGAHGRGYWAEDLPLVLALGIASGYCTVVVMALYINSMDSQTLYSHHKPLWLVCPLLLYWISRIWLLTTRGLMHDDPVVFALKDRTSLAVLAVLALIVMVSI